MKTIFYSLCLLIGLSSGATTVDDHILSLNSNDNGENRIESPDCDLDTLFKVTYDEVTDECFEFDTKKYLPTNFNAYSGLFEEYELVQELGDQAFDFNTAAYLPVGFNATATYLSNIIEIATVEADESFDFNTADYLPVGFNMNTAMYDTIEEIAINEVDEPFEFDTKQYLPEDFNAQDSQNSVSTIY